ncbi:disulfide bond formation protein DsbA [Sinorhizobium medicae]|uniref:DSBA oxidoreductase n=2 Tax=Sinorhizobium medicae TaxID=110321 RepID=A0A508WXR4_9HYPH|nr:DsbA family protein [Sinorhizobium medicae]ABR60244.1 DSBA oxidoreductase [Sinorhizobium medicae WSM419]MBO1940257.1 DsbA family protein [Sinorhizobium medicae]MBO1962411.1 DsbA family protein [Sinorhizobium medicae]MDX0408783.1 disulfide bond formation protein DsbA [Sinorhizobium medicae]MDX0413968.1 disulfide bond formation protein DsbA [Sinorhizobium medicae]
METVNIDIVSDVVCPWCYLGKNRLAQAIANVSGEINVAVQWRPYQLNPDLPPEGVDHKQHLAAKLGGQAAVDDAHRMLENLGMEDGVAFNFDAVKVSPNTLDAHRLIRWAATSGEAAQAELVNLLFKAYFEEGRNVGEHTVLLDIAEQGGLERPVIAALLASDADKQAVKQEIDMAREIGVTGVPCFIIEQQYAVMGAQSVEVLSSALREIAQMKAEHPAH